MKLEIILSGLLILNLNSAFAETWNLPQELSKDNAEISFEVDSTWHLIKGVVKQIEGQLSLENPKDFRSIKGKIILPVSSFDTDNESRDEELRSVMHSETEPNVIFEFSNTLPSVCDPLTLKNSQSCTFEISGDLTINGITRKTVLNSQVTQIDSSYLISGETVIKWAEFNVEDPSILIAKLSDEVKIIFSLRLDPKG